MQKKHQYIWIIIISAVTITVLANIGLLNRFFKLLQLQELTAEKKEEYWFMLRIGSVGVLSELIILIVFIFFNYSWKDYIIPKKVHQRKRVSLIILSNLLLLIGFIYADFLINTKVTKVLTAPEISLFLKNYFINHLFVLTVAFVTPYILLRMQKARSIELNLIKMKEEKSIAELSALKEQISPHFFFNTLSALSTIVRNQSKEASLEYIQDISKTYRYTLKTSKANLVPLPIELDFIKSYTYLLQKRFEEKLIFQFTISDDALQSNIPPMSIQLLIENAVQHNIMTTETPLTIHIYSTADHICVENNLQEKDSVESFGIGLANLNNRYKLISNKEISIEKKAILFLVKLPILS